MSFPFICFDTEDNSRELMESGASGFDKQVTQIAAITAEGKRYHNRGNVKHFLQWIERQPEKYIYALNVGYDLGNLFADEIDVLDQVLVGGRVIRANWRKKVFVDVFNIWPMSVARLGDAFGLQKLEFDANSREYVYRDVEIIRAAMLFAWQFCEHIGVEYLPATLGGLCVKVWKTLGGANVHDSTVISREAYYGGRVELFKRRNDSNRLCWTDINSLYPSVMTGRFPDVLEDQGKTLDVEYGIAKVTVQVPETALAPLPWRNDEKRILYPWGKFTGSWTLPEIRAAVAMGAKVLKVHQVMGTNDFLEPYSEFVTRLYKVRRESKSEGEKLFYKLLMNNLYGRLGATGVIARSVWQTEKNKFDGVPYGNKVLCKYSMPLSEEVNWAHAAYVTAYGRLALMGYMQTIGAAAMIYCDTDSTIFDCPGRKAIPFPIGDDLGQMKLVSWEKSCETYAPKLYRCGNQYKAKGVPKKLAKEFIQTGHAEFDLPFKMREGIRFFDRYRAMTDKGASGDQLARDGARKVSVWRKVEKVNRQVYDRKRLNGNQFLPCKVNCI